MTSRQRLLETLLFGQPDRVPLAVGGGRESTRARWYSEGLPRTVSDISEYAYRQAGGTLPWPTGGAWFGVDHRMLPMFEEKVIELRPTSQIVQDWKGNICEIGLEFSPLYLRNAIDFVTRRWIKCPVESRADWENVKWRYNPDDPARLPPQPAELGTRLRERDHVITWSFHGPFWQLREWCGFEGLCLLLIEDPAFVHEMCEFWTDYVLRLLRNGFRYVVPDEIHLSEDMAFKAHSMISPAMTREFLKPAYDAWHQALRQAGVKVFSMDSDGYVGELIPIWIESGFDVCDPMEVAAHNDLVACRREFGHAIAFRGGVDKRAMAKGGEALRAEIERIAPIVADGGYVPGCDHGVPADVSWANYVETTRLLAKVTGWL
jgi:uroporphyrinogen decarboxylase